MHGPPEIVKTFLEETKMIYFLLKEKEPKDEFSYSKFHEKLLGKFTLVIKVSRYNWCTPGLGETRSFSISVCSHL
jgi:hypothetical protein